MALEVIGKVVKLMPEVTGQGQKGPWNKQDFVIETVDQFPKKVCFTAWGEKANDLKQYTPGDTLKVTFNLESREYNDRWYTEARAWRIEQAEGESGQPTGTMQAERPRPSVPRPTQPAPTPFGSASFDEETNDLPF